MICPCSLCNPLHSTHSPYYFVKHGLKENVGVYRGRNLHPPTRPRPRPSQTGGRYHHKQEGIIIDRGGGSPQIVTDSWDLASQTVTDRGCLVSQTITYREDSALQTATETKERP